MAFSSILTLACYVSSKLSLQQIHHAVVLQPFHYKQMGGQPSCTSSVRDAAGSYGHSNVDEECLALEIKIFTLNLFSFKGN